MSEERVRIDGDEASPLHKLKCLPKEEHEFLLAQRDGKDAISVRKLIAQIETRHGIHGLSPQRWSEFVEWFRERESISEANDSVENLRSMATTAQTPDQVHAWCVDLLRITGLRTKDLKTLKFVTQEIRKVMQLSHSREKWQSDQREKIEAGLDAVFEDIKHDAVAAELFAKIRERIRPEDKSAA